jgi:hypothetical protein
METYVTSPSGDSAPYRLIKIVVTDRVTGLSRDFYLPLRDNTAR